jgi:hypothetical protein
MADPCAAARDRLLLASRSSAKLTDGMADWQPEAAAATVDALIGIGYALVAITEELRDGIKTYAQ